MKKVLVILLFPFLLGAIKSDHKPGSYYDSIVNEYELKAKYIENFAQYIEWPEGSIKDNFVIGVIGNSKIIKPLNIIAKKNKVKERNLVIQEWKELADISACQILFIDPSMKKFLPLITAKAADEGALTISEGKGFCEKGVGINFFLEGANIRFEINRQRVKETKLTVSSQLLKLAVLIDEKQE